MRPSDKEELRRQMLDVAATADSAIANLFWMKKPFLHSSEDMSAEHCLGVMLTILTARRSDQKSSRHPGKMTTAMQQKIHRIRQALETVDASSAGELALAFLRVMATVTESDIELMGSEWADFQKTLAESMLTRVTDMAPAQCPTTRDQACTNETLEYVQRLPEIVDKERELYPPECILPPKEQLDLQLGLVAQKTATVPFNYPSVPRMFKYDVDFQKYPREFQALFSTLAVIHPDHSCEVLNLVDTCRKNRERSGSMYPESYAIMMGLYNLAVLPEETFDALGHWAYVDLMHYVTSATAAELFDQNVHLLPDDVRFGKQTRAFTTALAPRGNKWLLPRVEGECPVCLEEIDEEDLEALETFKKQWTETNAEIAPNFDPLKRLTQTFCSRVDINQCGHICHGKFTSFLPTDKVFQSSVSVNASRMAASHVPCARLRGLE